MQLKRMIEIGIDARGAKTGAQEVQQAMNTVGKATGVAKEQIDKLDKQIDGLAAESKGAKAELSRLDSTMGHLDQTSRTTAARLDKAEQAIEEMGAASRSSSNDLQRLSKVQDETGKATSALYTHITRLVSGYAVLRTSMAIVGNLTSFESGLVGVGKTTDLAGDELEDFGKRIVAMSARLGVGQGMLFATAQSAGQLGIRGTTNLEKFTETITKLGTATNLVGESAATTLARLLNVTGESAGTVDRVGAVIVGLGNQSAATEREIADIGTSIAQASAVFKMGSVDALAFGATLASMGQESRLAGSTIGRALREIDAAIREGGQAFKDLAELTKMPGAEFEKLFRSDPSQALVVFLRGLKSIIDQGGSAATALEKFGLTGDEVLKVLPTLATQVDYLASRLEIARDEAEKSTALNKEYSKFYDTLIQRLSVLGTTIQASITDNLKPVIPLLTDVATAGTALIAVLSGDEKAAASAGTAMLVFVEAVKIGTTALLTFTAVKTTFFLAGLAKELVTTAIATATFRAAMAGALYGLGPLQAGIAVLTFSLKGLATSVMAFFASIGPAGWIIIGVTAVVTLMRTLRNQTDEYTASLERMSRATVSLKAEVGQVQDIFYKLSRAQQLNDLGSQSQQLEALAAAYESFRQKTVKDSDLDAKGGYKPDHQSFFTPTVDVAELRETFNDAGKQALDAFIEGYRKTAEAKLVNTGAGFPGSKGQQALANLAGIARAQANFSSDRKTFIDPNAPLDADKVTKIPATEAIKLLDAQADKARGSAKDLRAEIEKLAKSSLERTKLESNATVFAAIKAEMDERFKLIGLEGAEKEAYLAIAEAKKQATSKGIQLTEDQIAVLGQLAKETFYYGDSVAKLNQQKAEQERLDKKAIEDQRRATESIEDLVRSMREETMLLALSGKERDRYNATLQVERALKGQLIGDTSAYVDAIYNEIQAQNELKATAEAVKKARDDEEDRLKKQQEALERLVDATKALEFETTLIGKTNDERERAIELVKIEKDAHLALGKAAELYLEDYENRLKRLQENKELFDFSKRIGDSFANVFDEVIFGAKSVEQAVGDMVKNVARMVFNELVTKQIAQFFTSLIYSGLGSAGFGGGHATGNVFKQGTVVPFAAGGIVNGPSYFPMSGNRQGLMGEAGPEAIMPLKRGSDGKLGVAVSGNSEPRQVVNVTMNITTADADSFRKSTTQLTNRVKRALRR